MNQARVTPELITDLKDNEIFVFGSNIAGRHGRGAAKTALKWGAIYGKGEGIQGQTYALPTVSESVALPLAIRVIAGKITRFLEYAQNHPEKIFLVTRVGCGLAGYTVDDIAPLFANGYKLPNVYYPKAFWDYFNERMVE